MDRLKPGLAFHKSGVAFPNLRHLPVVARHHDLMARPHDLVVRHHLVVLFKPFLVIHPASRNFRAALLPSPSVSRAKKAAFTPSPACPTPSNAGRPSRASCLRGTTGRPG